MRLILAAIVGFALLGVSSTSSHAAAPQLTVSPASGPCPSAITLRGEAFSPGATISIVGVFDLIEETRLAEVEVSADGTFTVTITADALPSSACVPGAALILRATDSASSPEATARYFVDSPWFLEVDPPVLACAEELLVTGGGFESGETVQLAVGRASESAVEPELLPVLETRADASGRIRARAQPDAVCAYALGSGFSEVGLYAWPGESSPTSGWGAVNIPLDVDSPWTVMVDPPHVDCASSPRLTAGGFERGEVVSVGVGRERQNVGARHLQPLLELPADDSGKVEATLPADALCSYARKNGLSEIGLYVWPGTDGFTTGFSVLDLTVVPATATTTPMQDASTTPSAASTTTDASALDREERRWSPWLLAPVVAIIAALAAGLVWWRRSPTGR